MMIKHGGVMHEKYNAQEPEKGPGAGGEYTPQVGKNSQLVLPRCGMMCLK